MDSRTQLCSCHLRGWCFSPAPWKTLSCHHLTQLRSWAGQRFLQGPRHMLATSSCCLPKRRWIATLLSWPSLVFQQTRNEYLTESWKKCSGVTFTNCNLLPSWWSPDYQDCSSSCEGAVPPQPALSPPPLPSASRAAPGRRFAEKPGVPKRNPEQMAAVAVQPQKGTFKSK